MSLVVAALLLSAQATADQTPAAPAPATSAVAPAPKAKEKMICRVDTTDSTSRLRKRECLTQTEWDRKEAGKDNSDLKSMGTR